MRACVGVVVLYVTITMARDDGTAIVIYRVALDLRDWMKFLGEVFLRGCKLSLRIRHDDISRSC